MNSLSLAGVLTGTPTYHCNPEARDLLRFILRTPPSGAAGSTEEDHHCLAWGPAALDLHVHLKVGDQLVVRGELRYRPRPNAAPGDPAYRIPEVYVKGYSYLGTEQGRGG